MTRQTTSCPGNYPFIIIFLILPALLDTGEDKFEYGAAQADDEEDDAVSRRLRRKTVHILLTAKVLDKRPSCHDWNTLAQLLR